MEKDKVSKLADNSCRVCATPTNYTLHPIFELSKGPKNRRHPALPIADMITAICLIRIELGDGKSEMICALCLNTVETAYKLRRRSMKVDADANKEKVASEAEEPPAKKRRSLPAVQTGSSSIDDQMNTPPPTPEPVSMTIEIDDDELNETPSSVQQSSNVFKIPPGNFMSASAVSKKVNNATILVDTGCFVCNVCKKDFFSSAGIARHFELQHPGQTMDIGHSCLREGCEKKFATANELAKHKLDHKREKAQKLKFPSTKTPKTNRASTPKKKIPRSKTVHSYQCAECNLLFVSPTGLNIHRSRQHGLDALGEDFFVKNASFNLP